MAYCRTWWAAPFSSFRFAWLCSFVRKSKMLARDPLQWLVSSTWGLSNTWSESQLLEHGLNFGKSGALSKSFCPHEIVIGVIRPRQPSPVYMSWQIAAFDTAVLKYTWMASRSDPLHASPLLPLRNRCFGRRWIRLLGAHLRHFDMFVN